MTFVDEDGERWARHWFLPRTKEDLACAASTTSSSSASGRGARCSRGPPASMLPVFYTLYQDPEPWEQESQGHDGRPLAQNIRDKWDYLMRERPLGVADVPRRPGRPLVAGHGGRDADAAHGGQERRGDRRARLEGDRHGRGVRQRDLHGRAVEARHRRRAGRLRARAGQRPERHPRRAPVAGPARRRRVRPAAGQPRRRARRDGVLRRRAHPVGPRLPHRQPRPREVLSAAAVRLDPRRDADPPRRQRRGHRRPGHPHHRGAGDRAGADRRLAGRRPRPLPRDVPRLRHRRRGDRLHVARRPLQAEQHLRRLRARALPRARPADDRDPHRLLRARGGRLPDEGRPRQPRARRRPARRAARPQHVAPRTARGSSG